MERKKDLDKRPRASYKPLTKEQLEQIDKSNSPLQAYLETRFPIEDTIELPIVHNQIEEHFWHQYNVYLKIMTKIICL
jgi:hypothetical protein